MVAAGANGVGAVERALDQAFAIDDQDNDRNLGVKSLQFPGNQCAFGSVAIQVDHNHIRRLRGKATNPFMAAGRTEHAPGVVSQERAALIQT